MTFNWETRSVTANASIEPLVTPRNPQVQSALVADVALGGARWKRYSQASVIASDLAAGLLTAAAAGALTLGLTQNPRPQYVAVIRQDVTNSETLAQALDAAVADGFQFYYFSIESRAAADHELANTWAAARRYIFIGQTGLADWLTAGVPTAYATWVNTPATMLVYHPTPAQWADYAYAARMSAIDPNEQCSSFVGPIAGVDSYDLTEAQAGHALANKINVIGDIRSHDVRNRLGEGTSLDGEFGYARLSKHWFELSVIADTTQAMANYDSTARKIPGNEEGAGIILTIANNRGAQGADPDVGHFTPKDGLPNGFLFAATYDAATRKGRVTGEANILDALTAFDFSINLTRSV